MSTPDLAFDRPRAAPGWRSVLRTESRLAGGALRGELMARAAVLAAMMLLMVVLAARGGGGADLDLADMTWPPILVAFFAPFGVWKHESPSRRGYLWAMPMDRARHVLARVLGGWGWLMAIVAVYLVWALAVAYATGGNVVISPSWERYLLRGLPAGTQLRDFGMNGNPWMWLVPFTSATAAYLAATLVVLLTDHPWRVLAAFALVYFAPAMIGTEAGVAAIVRVYDTLTLGRFGFVTLATGTMVREAPHGTPAFVPHCAAWAGATLLWTLPLLAAVIAAAHHHQER